MNQDPLDERYDRRAYDLARFVDDPVDDALSGLVDATTAASTAELDVQRRQFSEADSHTLLLFAARQSVIALREQDVRSAVRAVVALTLVDPDRIDHRDLSVDFALYAAVETGAGLDQVLDQAIARSASSTAAVFEAARARVNTLSLATCRLLPVRTHYGLGFLDIIEDYDPRTGLAETAIELADAIDAEGTYRTLTLGTSQLPRIWFNRNKRGGHIRNTGCISIHAERIGSPPWSHGLLIFLAQVRRSSEAAKLIAQLRDVSSPRRPRVGLIEESRLLVIIGGSSRTDDEALETELSLARFTALYPESTGS